VLFRISAQGAAAVAVVGDFNGWDPARGAMSKTANGWWEVHLTIEPGQYQYGFVIDGEHVPPPNPYATVEDGFGGLNGLLVVPE
jgi:1,4-alpha-glucan branching enzyme